MGGGGEDGEDESRDSGRSLACREDPRDVRPGRHADFVRTVDIAPTLADIAGTKPLEKLDGVVLRAARP